MVFFGRPLRAGLSALIASLGRLYRFYPWRKAYLHRYK